MEQKYRCSLPRPLPLRRCKHRAIESKMQTWSRRMRAKSIDHQSIHGASQTTNECLRFVGLILGASMKTRHALIFSHADCSKIPDETRLPSGAERSFLGSLCCESDSRHDELRKSCLTYPEWISGLSVLLLMRKAQRISSNWDDM